jgi:cytochrome c oxidase cbb3-type subunit 2
MAEQTDRSNEDVGITGAAGASETKDAEAAVSAQKSESILAVIIAAVAVAILGWVVAVVMPAAGSANTTPTNLAESRKTAASTFDTPEARGRKIYITEGCYSCHTMQVRQVMADAYLGPVSRPGDYAYDDPELLGTQRIGPDLTHVGSRELAKDSDKLGRYLRDPRSERPWSTMPSFSYLSDDELRDLIAYLQTLK